MPVDDIPLDAVVRVAPGERIALDGVIISGHSTVNQSAMTGESMPLEKQVGDNVYAGTLNENGAFDYRVTAAASDTMLARIRHAVEQAQDAKAPPSVLSTALPASTPRPSLRWPPCWPCCPRC
jgi:Cd2+/Zn2+-exporting ATPase